MISCGECQKRIVAVFDSECSEGDEELISMHLKGCPECRAFQEEMVRIGQEFVSIPVASLPAAVGQELLREVSADGLQGKSSHPKGRGSRQPWPLGLRRLAWAGGIVGLALIVLSCLACFILAKEVVDLRRELRVARQAGGPMPSRNLLANNHESRVGEILSVEETSEKLRELVSVAGHYRTQGPFRVAAVQPSLSVSYEVTPERLAALEGFWRDPARQYVKAKIVSLKELHKIAHPAFDRVIQSCIDALEAFEAGRTRDAIELIQEVERSWNVI